MTDAQPNHPDNGYDMDEVDLCKSCGAMKHLNADGTCGRCAPNHPDLTVEDRIDEIISLVKYELEYDVTHGGCPPRVKAVHRLGVKEAHAAILRLVLEGQRDAVLGVKDQLALAYFGDKEFIADLERETGSYLAALAAELGELGK